MCKDLNLTWGSTFKLLGINFDSDLAYMDNNFYKKLQEIRNIYKNWKYRYLTPMGKITVIKSLALSKLSDVAMVCPHLKANILKELNSLSFQFLWNNKPDRIKRSEAVLPIEKGGLGMVDIDRFWQSLKLSWIRRLLNTKCVWEKILSLNLLYNGYELSDLWTAGPAMLSEISSKISNEFWKETFQAVGYISTKNQSLFPQNFLNFNIFNNDLFSINGNYLCRKQFNTLWSRKLVLAGDYYDLSLNPPKLLSKQEFNKVHNIEIDFLSYHRITKAMEAAKIVLNQKTFSENLSDYQMPRLPALARLCTLQAKGCQSFYKTLMLEQSLNCNTANSEAKWHQILKTTYSVIFWDKAWQGIKKSVVSNKAKWFYFQCLKYILPTNLSVSKYKNSQDPKCSFCSEHDEKIESLLWECQKVREFWTLVNDILKELTPTFQLKQKEALFTYANSPSWSALNTVLSLSRYFIWIKKFGNKKLDVLSYKNFMRTEIWYSAKVHKKRFNDGILPEDWIWVCNTFGVEIHSNIEATI